jgi:hypothetical protein
MKLVEYGNKQQKSTILGTITAKYRRGGWLTRIFKIQDGRIGYRTERYGLQGDELLFV